MANTGMTVCQMHGGGSPNKGRPGGINKKYLQDGKYSKLLPVRMFARYEAARNDPQLLEMTEEINLLDARLSDVLSRVDTGEAGLYWAELQKSHAELIAALGAKDNYRANVALGKLGGIIEHGVQDYAAWGEIAGLIEQRRKLVESERKRMVQMKAVVSIDEAMGIIKAMYDLVKTNADFETFERVKAGFMRLVAGAGDAIVIGDEPNASE